MESQWRFTPMQDDAGRRTRVTFDLTFSFRSVVYAKVCQVFFPQVAAFMVHAFQKRFALCLGDGPDLVLGAQLTQTTHAQAGHIHSLGARDDRGHAAGDENRPLDTDRADVPKIAPIDVCGQINNPPYRQTKSTDTDVGHQPDERHVSGAEEEDSKLSDCLYMRVYGRRQSYSSTAR